MRALGSKKEIRKAFNAFEALGKINLFNLLQSLAKKNSSIFNIMVNETKCAYATLKLGGYAITEEIENLLIDNPQKGTLLLYICKAFITDPFMEMRCCVHNRTFRQIRDSLILPLVYQPKEIRFSCEIGKFLLEKLTYAPQGIRACYDLIDHFDSYDLLKVQESLNEAIVANHPDVVSKSAQELSEILDNVWNDKTIPRKVKGLQIGMPLSMAAIGSVAAGPIGAAGGFLAGLGYSVVDRFIDLETEGLSERIAKLKTRSYQANVYDFKKKYKGKIVS